MGDLALLGAAFAFGVGSAILPWFLNAELYVVGMGAFVPDSLLFSWELLTDGTPLEGCELVIDHVPAVIRCTACEHETTLDMPIMLCAACESSDVTIVSGEEFLVSSIERTKEVC